MFYKLGKKLFDFFINALHFVQVVLIFLAFATILYWLLQLGGVTFIQPVAPFFEAIKGITHLFYLRTVKVDEVTIDFSFLVAAFVFLLVVWALKFVIEYVEFFEEKYDSIHKYLKKKREDVFNFALHRQNLANEYRYDSFLIFIKFSAINLAKDSMFSRDINVGVEQKQAEILKDFSANIEESLKCQKKILKDGVLLYFSTFDDVDRVLCGLKDIMSILKRKYDAQKWQTTYFSAIEIYAKPEEIAPKTEKLTKLTELALKNKIVCFATFKQRYSLSDSPKHRIEGKGIYRLGEMEEEIFCIEDLKSFNFSTSS